PIVVDYSGASIQTLKAENRAAAALRYPNRVCGITIRLSHLWSDSIYRAMNHSFPILESFKLCDCRTGFKVPMPIIKTSAPSLRRLHLPNVLFASVSQLLSSTTGLVELDLNIDTIVCLSTAASLLTHLQGMPCLRRLQLNVLDPYPPTTSIIPVLPMRAADVVPLLRLTHFQFSGSTTCFEALAAGLAAPFLQDLEIELNDDDDYSPTFPHLSRFIGDVEGQFSAVHISMLTHSHSIDEPPRRIAIRNLTWSLQIGTAFGARLTTAEQLFFECHWIYYESRFFDEGPITWHGFFEQFQNVKILRVGRDLLLEPPLLLLPALEEIELRSTAPFEVLSTLSAFTGARQRVDPAFPSPYW
ncbi:hypothetical protein BJV78DRAFT_1189465, partial [Lactifluus subvellereus]